MVSFLATLAIQAALFVLGRLLAPKIKRPKPTPFDAPRAEAGAPYTVVFGTGQVAGQVMFVREVEQSDTPEGYTYYLAKMGIALCYGPIDSLWEIVADELPLSMQRVRQSQYLEGTFEPLLNPTLPYTWAANDPNPLTLNVAVRQAFGGKSKEGGLHGQCRIYRGHPDQPLDPLVEVALDDLASRYPWLAYICFGNAEGEASTSGMEDKWLWGANTPTPKPISLLVGRFPRLLASGDGSGRVNGYYNCNLVEAIYEVLRNDVWGRGFPESRFNVPQWKASADQIFAEGLGASYTFDTTRNTDDLIEDMQSHVRGQVVTNPTTGLLEFKLARPDYDPDTLFTLTKDNTDNFRQVEALAPRTVNRVVIKYRRLEGMDRGLVERDVTGQEEAIWSDDIMYWSSGANTLENVHVYQDLNGVITELTGEAADPNSHPSDFYAANPTLDFFYSAKGGYFWIKSTFFDNDAIVYITYVANPTYRGFVDDAETDQNLANAQITGTLREQAYDFPMLTTPEAARRQANLQVRMDSLSLPEFEWEMRRDGSHLTPVDVVKVDEAVYRLLEYPIRITDIDYGTTAEPTIRCRGVKDIWGESLTSVQPDIVAPPSVVLPPETLPAIAAIFCIDEDQIGVQAGDPTYNIEVQQADDVVPTNPIIITAAGGVAGTTTTFAIVIGKVHRARHVRGTDVGPWTVWLAACPVGTDPGCVEPTYTVDAVDQAGTLTLTLTDSQNRVTLVEFRQRVGAGAWTEWTADTTPFDHVVDLVIDEASRIEWRITYIDCDGLEVVLLNGYDFEPSPPVDPPVEPAPRTSFEILLYEATATMVGFNAVAAAPAVLCPWMGMADKFPLDGVVSARLEANILESSLPVGAYIGIEYEDGPGAYFPLDGVEGPVLPIDETSLLALHEEAENDGVLPVIVTGEPVLLQVEAKRDVRFRVRIWGGDADVAKTFTPIRIALQLDVVAEGSDPEDPEVPVDPPVVDPGSCSTPTPIDMSAGTPDDEGGVNTVWVLTSTSGELVVTPGATGHSLFSHALTELAPNELHTFYLTVSGDTGGTPFLEIVGGTRVTGLGLLTVRGDSNGSGNLTIRWGVDDLETATQSTYTQNTEDYATVAAMEADGWAQTVTGGISQEVVMDTAIKYSGARSLKYRVYHPAWFSGSAYHQKTIAGFPANAAVSGTIYNRNASRPWFLNPIFQVGVGTTGLSPGPWQTDLTWGQLICSGGTIDGSGNLMLRIGASAASGVVIDWTAWFDDVLVVTIEGAGTFEITLSDLGFCEGSGVGTPPPPGRPGNVDTPIPPPPPGGWEPPPVGGGRPFTIHNVPAIGLAYWNGSIAEGLTPQSAPNYFNQMTGTDALTMFLFGPQSDWRDGSGQFSFAHWKARVDAVKNDARAMAAVEDGIAEGTFWAHYLIDEPFHLTRWGKPIPFAVVEQMAIYSKTVWPTWRTVIRVDPTDARMARKMVGVDVMWGEYSLARGPVVAYRDSRIAQCIAWNIGLVMALHYKHFEGPRGPSPRYITPAELEYYGGILARPSPTYPSFRTAGFGGWRYEAGLWSQSGFPAKLQALRNEYASTDPP